MKGKNEDKDRIFSRKEDSTSSPFEFLFGKRDNEQSTTSKIENQRNWNSRYYNEYGLTEEEEAMVAEIAKTRNNFFKALNPSEQMEVLVAEKFDFEEFKEDYIRKHKKGIFVRRSKRKVGEPTPEDEPFRTPVDYGFWNFIMRPLDDFLCWIKDDPTPKKPKQIQFIDHETQITYRNNNPIYMLEVNRMIETLLNKDNYQGPPVAEIKAREARVSQLFKHKTFRGYRKGVEEYMLRNGGPISRNLFEMMSREDFEEDEKEGKRKLKKSRYDEADFFDDDKPKKKKKKYYDDDEDDGEYRSLKKSEKHSKEEEAAMEEAKKIYKYYFQAASNNDQSVQPYGTKRMFKPLT